MPPLRGAALPAHRHGRGQLGVVGRAVQRDIRRVQRSTSLLAGRAELLGGTPVRDPAVGRQGLSWRGNSRSRRCTRWDHTIIHIPFLFYSNPIPDWAGSGQLGPRGGCGRHRAVPQPHGAQQGRTLQASHRALLLREVRHV